MKRRLVVVLFTFMMIIFSGCALHVNVQKSLVAEEDLLPRLKMRKPVSIDTLPHPSTGKVNFCDKGLGPITAVYAELTDYAYDSMVDILTRNDIPIETSAAKRLTLSIVEVSCVPEISAMKYVVVIKVLTGDSITKQFSGHQRLWSGRALSFTVTAATLNAVLEMFKDEEIKRYLEES